MLDPDAKALVAEIHTLGTAMAGLRFQVETLQAEFAQARTRTWWVLGLAVTLMGSFATFAWTEAKSAIITATRVEMTIGETDRRLKVIEVAGSTPVQTALASIKTLLTTQGEHIKENGATLKVIDNRVRDIERRVR